MRYIVKLSTTKCQSEHDNGTGILEYEKISELLDILNTLNIELNNM